MNSRFPLFQTSIDLAHTYWKQILKPGQWVLDATCGNGKDSLALAQIVLAQGEGRVLACDVQPQAIELTRQRLQKHLPEEAFARVDFHCGCHSQLEEWVESEALAIVVYNLGYLPGGDKELTTQLVTTLKSVKGALTRLQPGGVLSITCYPGHDAGAEEEQHLLRWAKALDPSEWSACHHHFLNRQRSPSLLLIQRLTSEL